MKDPNACRTPERRRQIASLAGTARGRKLSKQRLQEIARMGYRAMKASLAARKLKPPEEEVSAAEGDAA